jgi:hypothetical protein
MIAHRDFADVTGYRMVGTSERRPPQMHEHPLREIDKNEDPTLACDQCKLVWSTPHHASWWR